MSDIRLLYLEFKYDDYTGTPATAKTMKSQRYFEEKTDKTTRKS
jgi:hypothetical protein